MTKTRQNHMHRADALFSKLVRDRDRACQAAGTDTTECRGNLQSAHIHSRSYKSIRTNFDNAVALCAAHHLFYTHRPIEWEIWVRHNLGDARWEDLRALALRYDRVDWKLRHASLKELADSLGVR
jgi:hypothetical protein